MRAVTIDDQTRLRIEELLEHRAKVSGDLYLVSVRNVARVLMREILKRRRGNSQVMDYRGPNTFLHKYIAETLEKQGAQLWGIIRGGNITRANRNNTWANRVYQISKRQTE